MFTSKDLQLFDDEPRIKDITLGERAGLARPRTIRDIIERNKVDLERYGRLPLQTATSHEGPGARTVKEYWLNEGQAIRLCSLLRTPTAEAITHGVITVFVEWRKTKPIQRIDYNDPKQQFEFILAIAERAEKAERQLIVAKEKILGDAPKVEFFDRVAESKGLIKLQDVGRQLGLPPNGFTKWLRDNGYLFHQGRSRNVPFAKYGESGMHLFEVLHKVIDGENRQQTYMTPKGLQYFVAKGPDKEYFLPLNKNLH